jgi:hypothetical protein
MRCAGIWSFKGEEKGTLICANKSSRGGEHVMLDRPVKDHVLVDIFDALASQKN